MSDANTPTSLHQPVELRTCDHAILTYASLTDVFSYSWNSEQLPSRQNDEFVRDRRLVDSSVTLFLFRVISTKYFTAIAAIQF